MEWHRALETIAASMRGEDVPPAVVAMAADILRPGLDADSVHHLAAWVDAIVSNWNDGVCTDRAVAIRLRAEVSTHLGRSAADELAIKSPGIWVRSVDWAVREGRVVRGRHIISSMRPASARRAPAVRGSRALVVKGGRKGPWRSEAKTIK